MKTSTVGAVVIGVLLAFASVAAASGYLWSRTSSAAPATTSARPSTDGQALRPVPIPAGELVTALPPDSIGQVLCQALSQDRWNLVLGGATLREVSGDGCHLVAGALDLNLTLDRTPAALNGAKAVNIAGHPGEVEFPEPRTNARLNVHLVTAPATEQIRPYLRIGVSHTTPGVPLDELIVTVAREVVAATMTDGPALPKVGPGRAIPPKQVEPIADHGIVDAPWPMISWQLCTALVAELGGTGKPEFDGRCTVRGIQAAYTDLVSPRRYPDLIAGQPALITDDLVAVKLTGDSAQELTFTGSGRSLEAIAEHVLPALLGRS
ncbi:hypothetical protein [Amycolatopsis taiwanensis]|uniref:hypothetical protein n=1 Tax=Amycolatopsis taiwanensis TaxID=342230 RepID=UPI00048A2055|nr:hypothetical protein [Amycolatopsis taiwanensis]